MSFPESARLTFVMAVYGQPLMLEKWWETLRTYDAAVLDRLHLVIVDDHGDPPAAIPRDIQELLDCQLLRVTESIAWNQMGARNLGVREARTPWVLMLDPDMVVEPKVARRLLEWILKLRRGCLVKLLLRYTNGVLDSSSPNVYLIHKEDFAKIGGYDEDYRGHKGWSDVQLLHTLTGFKMQFLKPTDLWVRYYRSQDIADATVASLSRNTKHNRTLHLKKVGVAKQIGWAEWVKRSKGKNIRFTWQRIH